MTQITYPLKYLFIAQFSDGTKIEQTLEDKSVLEPDTRSQYYDVLQAIESGKTLISFALFGDEHLYEVNLQNGVFSHNGKTFLVGDELDAVEPLKINYYRRVRHNFNQNQEYLETEVAYFLGFQTIDKEGLPLERKIGVD